MLKRLCICLLCTVFVVTAGYFIYADKSGLFLEDDEQAKALICRDIKTGNDGKAFTSCDECIRIAVRLVEEELGL